MVCLTVLTCGLGLPGRRGLLLADGKPEEQLAGAATRRRVCSAHRPGQLSCALPGRVAFRTRPPPAILATRGLGVEPLTGRGRSTEPHTAASGRASPGPAPTPGQLWASSPLFLGGLRSPRRRAACPAFAARTGPGPSPLPRDSGIWCPDVWLFFYFHRKKKTRRKPLQGMSSLVEENAEPLLGVFVIKKRFQCGHAPAGDAESSAEFTEGLAQPLPGDPTHPVVSSLTAAPLTEAQASPCVSSARDSRAELFLPGLRSFCVLGQAQGEPGATQGR